MIINPILPLFILYIFLAVAFGGLLYCLFRKKTRKAKNIRRIITVVLVLTAMLRPGLNNGVAERELSNLNIFFVVDNTGSMAAKDMDNMNSYRYKVAADDMNKLVNLFYGSKYAIIALDYDAYQAMPLIDSADTAHAYFNALTPKESNTSASSDLSGLLKTAGEKVKQYHDRYPDRDNILFFLSDGENDNNVATSIPSGLKELLVGGAVIGYGTTTGTHIGKVVYNMDYKTNTYSFDISDTKFILDPTTRKEHISKLDENNLMNIANGLGLQYYRRTSSGDKFNSIDNFANKNATYHNDGEKSGADNEFYWLFMLIAAALLFWDFAAILNSLSLERKAAK